MKEYLKALVSTVPNPLHARNLAREYLQALILQSLQRSGAMLSLAFLGGTALRFLFNILRYSEDLDFSLQGESRLYDFDRYTDNIRRGMEAQGYRISLKISNQKTVHNAFIRFPGLLFELGLSPHQDEVMAVKIEVDTHPPQGATLATTLVRRHVLLNIQHHDQSSLMAGKMHALLQRPYLKGRDVYDLIWYLSDPDWPAPNLALLNNALAQTGWRGDLITADSWRKTLYDHLVAISWDQVLADVEPFLSSPEESVLLTSENLYRLLIK